MPFAIIGFMLAIQDYDTNIMTFIYIILSMIFARSAAMAFNRYLDRDIDKKNIRTAKIREIPNGSIKARSALKFAIINVILFIITTFLINRLCFFLSPVALFIILGYSYTKRFTSFCHIILGIGLGLAPLGSYLAVANEFNSLAILFSVLVIFWVSGFDIIYSLQDFHFDKNHKLNSIPVLFGIEKALIICKILHFACILTTVIIGLLGDFNVFYWMGATIFSSLIIYQNLIVKSTDLTKINLAFFTTNGIASILFCILIILDLNI